jgi:[protein-PII] uridylyltransferase
LKEDVGGLRDVHALGWLSVIARVPVGEDDVDAATALILAAREALHAESKRKLDRLRIDLQPRVARRLGLEGDDAADELMTAIHSADAADGSAGIERAMRARATRSRSGRPIARASLAWITSLFARAGEPQWTPEMREAFFELLAGPHAASALETLDQVGAWRALMPEWLGVRGRAQHDPYHRYTVDGHSFLTVSEAVRVTAEDGLAQEAARDAGDMGALLLAALLHDVGKGSGEDHSVAGARLAESVCARMGLAPAETDTITFLVRHHLLLVDTATRRDLEDSAVVTGVAGVVGDARLLRLLVVLTVADGRATGPQGWSAWKEALVGELWRKTLAVLETGSVPDRGETSLRQRATAIESVEPTLAGRVQDVLETLPPSYFDGASDVQITEDVRMLLRPAGSGRVRHRVDEADDAGRVTITVVVPDRPGTLARTAGVLALHRISVLRAQAYSVTTGHALERFTVAPPEPESLDRFVGDLESAYAGRLSVDARLARKVSDYRPPRPFSPDVRILQDESEHSTVVEVRAPDALGLLYAITAGLSDLDLDIHVAKIDTLGSRVVDVFYVRSSTGDKLDDDQAAEVARSIEHRISRLFA